MPTPPPFWKEKELGPKCMLSGLVVYIKVLFLKTVCRDVRPGLIPLPKSMFTYFCFILISWGCHTSPTFFFFCTWPTTTQTDSFSNHSLSEKGRKLRRRRRTATERPSGHWQKNFRVAVRERKKTTKTNETRIAKTRGAEWCRRKQTVFWVTARAVIGKKLSGCPVRRSCSGHRHQLHPWT
jgi:hypothetical protein